MHDPISHREEDYLKAIFTLSHGQAVPVAPGELVVQLAVTSAAVTRMTQRLAEAGLLHRTAYQGVTLTERGRHHALRVLRRHRLAELFLVAQLGFDWAEVDEEVEALEHAMSDAMTARLEALLGFPRFCPHGDPIPDATLALPVVRERPLTTLPDGVAAIISRVAGDAALLREAGALGLRPGTPLRLLARAAAGTRFTVQRGDARLEVGAALASALFVRRPDKDTAEHRAVGSWDHDTTDGENAR